MTAYRWASYLIACLKKKFLGKEKNLSLTTALEQAELKW